MKKEIAGSLLVCSIGCGFHLAHAEPISGQGTWETTLQARDLDGDPATIEAYYDSVLGITWLANASYAGVNPWFAWGDAKAWAADLNIHGITGWRLPKIRPLNGLEFVYTNPDWDGTLPYPDNGSADQGKNVSAPGTQFAGSHAHEMAHLYYNTLGNHASMQPWLRNTGPFEGIGYYYWYDTAYDLATYDEDGNPYENGAWVFNVNTGGTGGWGQPQELGAWAVHDGDVGMSPGSARACEPASDYEPRACGWIYRISNMDELRQYQADYGLRWDGYYPNVRIVKDLGDPSTTLDIRSPCKITVASRVALRGSRVYLDGQEGVQLNWHTKINAGGVVCLASKKGNIELKARNGLTAGDLQMKGRRVVINP